MGAANLKACAIGSTLNSYKFFCYEMTPSISIPLFFRRPLWIAGTGLANVQRAGARGLASVNRAVRGGLSNLQKGAWITQGVKT